MAFEWTGNGRRSATLPVTHQCIAQLHTARLCTQLGCASCEIIPCEDQEAERVKNLMHSNS
jgi:hypothetical protein